MILINILEKTYFQVNPQQFIGTKAELYVPHKQNIRGLRILLMNKTKTIHFKYYCLFFNNFSQHQIVRNNQRYPVSVI